MKHLFYILVFSLCNFTMYAQDSLRVAFYNVENLFDTLDQEGFADEFYTPSSDLGWNAEKYHTKLDRLAEVIEMLSFPDVMGLAEVENRKVLEDLIHHGRLSQYGYDIVHFETRDFRGIDCALIYRKEKSKLIDASLIPILIDDPDYTGRDALKVELMTQEKAWTVVVVHWPSRSGGLQKTNPRRWSAARQVRAALAGFQKEGHCVIMGDFNDEPSDVSIKDTLGAALSFSDGSSADWYNLAGSVFEKGLGTYNYRGNWNLLDQMIGNQNMLDCSDNFCMRSMKILKDKRLMFEHPRFGSSPSRTSGGPNYYGGYSDHLPIYSTLIIGD